MNLSEFLCELIEERGVNHIFYVPGGAIIHLVKAFHKSKIQLVPAYSEQAAVVAAEAYSKYTRNLGVALVTSGPGVTNAATGIVSAYVDRSNILVIAGFVQKSQIKNSKTRSFGPQEFCVKDLYDRVTINNNLIDSAGQLDVLIETFNSLSAQSVFGPSIIQLCLDIQASSISSNDIAFVKNSLQNTACFEWSSSVLKRLAEELSSYFLSNKKVSILLGGGCLKNSDSIELAQKICNIGSVPICVSWQAKDLIDHSSVGFVGLPGYFANRSANYCLDESECIIVIGCRLDLLQLGFTNKNFRAHIIQVDIDHNELCKQGFISHSSYHLDAVSALKSLHTCLERLDVSANACWTSGLKKIYDTTRKEYVEKNFIGGLNPYKVVDILSDYKCDIYIAGSSGGCAEISFLNFFLRLPTRFINMPGLGSMGFGISCMGMAVNAFPEKTIYALIGDGGLHMNLQELAMLSQSSASKAYLFILNNSGYDSIRRSQNNYLGEYLHCDSASGMFLPDWKHIAQAYSLNYRRIGDLDEFRSFMSSNSSGIWLIDVEVAPNVPSAPKITPSMTKSGQITSGGLKDLA